MKQLLLVLSIVLTAQLRAADYYWVGGAGNWSDLNHWRLGSSSGSIPSIVPSSADNVFFDANSGFAPGSIRVTLNGNAFCNNMTWGNVQSTPQFVNASTSFTVQVSGNMVLNPITYYEAMFVFTGSSNATITTGGNVSGQFGMTIDKGTGSLTVTDSLVVPSTVISAVNVTNFVSGTFNIAGKKVVLYSLGSQNNNARTLEMTNATVICNSGSNSGFKVTGLNKIVNATGSTIVAYGYNTDEGVYGNVTITSANGPNTVFVNNSTIKKLTFNPVVGSVFSNIGSNNTVDTIIFNGAGGIGYNYGGGNIRVSSNNTVGYVKFALAAQINGSNNVIGKIECSNSFLVNTSSTVNTVDSLILAPNRTSNFWGTFNINKYLYVAGAPCEAYTQITGDSTNGTVNFAAGAVVDISNVILTGIKATGPVTPIALNGIDGGGNAGFTITEPSGTGTTLYWVGGAGDWNDKAHWSFSSGGPGGACVPFKNDSVVFDGNSGLTGGTVTTSSYSFCKGLTWAAGVGATTFNESPSYPFYVYGSVVMQSSVTYSATLDFFGTDATTLTTNGGGTGNFSFSVNKTASGSVTLLDNWINTGNASAITYSSGGLSLAGRTVTCWVFSSNTNSARNLDISNATITANLRWIYLGSNKTMTATGSHLIANGLLQINNPGSNYPWIDATTVRQESNNYSIIGSTIGQLTFTNPAPGSVAAIFSSNTIRRLEYKGAGVIGSSGNNNIDSLILAGSRYYVFGGTNTIYKYIQAEATPCSGLTELRGSTAAATLAFQPAAEIHIDNVYIQSLKATGVMTPIALNGADAGGNAGWNFTAIAGGPRYWVGGSGDWNDPNHWSAASGGAPGACVPTVSNDVFFDAGSGFTAGSKTVSITSGNAYARNVDWTGAANAPIWSKTGNWNMEIWGDSIILNPAATFNLTVYAKGANPAFLKGNVLGNFDIFIDKPGGSLTLLNDYNNPLYNFGVVNGALNASGLTLTLQGLDNTFSGSGNPFAIDISNSRITTGAWRFVGTIANHSLNATNSIITTSEFQANGMQYDTVNVSGATSGHAVLNSATINRLTFTDPSTISAVGINGSNNILGRVEYKGSGTISGTNNVMGTLIFFPGNRYTLTAGTNNTVNDAWYGSGTPCRPTEIVSSSTTSNATLTKNGDPVSFDYIRLQRITAAGTAAPFEAQKHSTDLGNNANWTIAPYDGAAPILGLGPDTAVLPANFPITLRTDGFFGAPGSQFTWSDNSTADTLLVAGPGTYSIDVSFPDGCTIDDEIVVSLASTLPVTLVSFTAKQADCQSRLSWKVTDAVNFNRFEVERSADGHSYSKLIELPYTGASDYTWTDVAVDTRTSYYRLRMVDIDGEYEYSQVLFVRNNCQNGAIKVYPTVTDKQAQVVLPAGYERATIQVYNIGGQRMNPVVTGNGSVRTVHLQGFPKATYILQVINGTERKNFTIIKQ